MARRNKIWPESTDIEFERWKEMLFDSLCQHFVCLGIRLESIDETGKATGDHEILSISCLVISVNNQCLLVTAGHILRDLDERLKSGRVRLVHAFVVYHIGHHETDGRLMPFDYRIAKKHVVCQRHPGLDFGAILLPYYDVLDLMKNNIIPIEMESWRPRSLAAFESFRLLGLPTELARRFSDPSVPSTTLSRQLVITYVTVDAITDEAHKKFPFMILVRQQVQPTIPVFVGQITADIDFGIDGMSGGPIFGLITHPEGRTLYSVVAIQSENDGCNKEIIIGCPIQTVFNECYHFLNP
jgi:hypothetical protein